jgi:ABC-type transport system involved in multi-copper enzyme maturation permease subunit
MNGALQIGLLAAGPDVPDFQWQLTGLVVVLILVALIRITYSTRTGIIARATTKEAVRQPLFLLLLVFGILMIVINTYLPFFSLGEDVKMLKDCGLATILVSGLLLAVWTASTSIASEIEGKTAMTLLSKPITRRQFIMGKYLGILHAVIFLIVPLMLVLCFFILYKVGYDARESSKDIPDWINSDGGWISQERAREMMHMLPGFALMFMEIAVLTAVSTAISTRVPMIVNMVTTLSIFVVGHITSKLVATGAISNEIVEFMAKLFATILPNLDYYSAYTAVATGGDIPPAYLLAAFAYSVAYGSAMILLSFILFEDRDLA